jgi:hypothetical protein
VKDSDSESLKTFKGRNWYALDKSFVIEANWKEDPKEIPVPDMLGGEKV